MFITSPQIHNGKQWLTQGSVIEVDEASGTIIAVTDAGRIDTSLPVTTYEGILCPAFINTHCHLELSHMKGKIAEKTGLIPFLANIMLHRNDFTEEQKTTARKEAYKELIKNGVIAVGDIANSTDSIDVRALGALHMHTFIESTGFLDFNALDRYQFSEILLKQFSAQTSSKVSLNQSITPHAPYSVSQNLFKIIDTAAPASLLSIHNQESEAENNYYKSKTGAVSELLHGFGIDDDYFQPSGRSSLQTYLQWLSPSHPVIFVHNTFTSAEDIGFANAHCKVACWCLCPNANLYIEGRLPDVEMLMQSSSIICIGTDSLASNHELNILSELLTLKQNFSFLTWEKLLTWATYNGALALNMCDNIGSIEPGKKPGIIELANLDSKDATPQVTRIV